MTKPPSRPSPDEGWSSPLLRAFALHDAYLQRLAEGNGESWEQFLAANPGERQMLEDLGDPTRAASAAATPTSSPPTPPGTAPAMASGQHPLHVGRFRLVKLLGSGGFGAVYLAHDTDKQRDVALKLLHLPMADANRRSRFELEARALASLSHPGICPVHDFDLEAEQPWIALQLVRGVTLDELLEAQSEQPLTAARLNERVDLVRKVALALQHTHDHGFQHRDITPRNLMVSPEGDPVLVDFGLVREATRQEGLTFAGTTPGTRPYMSPERHEGKVGDARSDLWSLGVILFECLVGQRPFAEPQGTSTWAAVTGEGGRASLMRVRGIVPAPLIDVISKALEPDPGHRYAYAADLAEDLRRWLAREPVLARQVTVAERVRRWSKRQPLAAGLIVSLLGALGGIGVLAWHAREVAADESRARLASAQRAFAAAVNEASFGRWHAAAASYQIAADLGHDPIAIVLRRIELWDATLETARAQRALEGLVSRSDLAEHAPMVALLANDPTRRGDRELDEGWRQTLAELVGARSLPGAAHHFAQALLAKTLPQARAHLDAAIAIDPRHRPSNEMRWPVVLLVQGPQAALDEARRFSAMYPEDPLAALMQSLSLHLLGRVAEADALLAKPAMPPSVRKFRDFLTDFRNRLRAVVRLMMEATVHGYFGASKDVGELQIAGLQALFADLKIDELDEHVFTLRLPPAAKPLLSQCLAASAVMNVGGSRRPLDNLLANLPLELYYLFRAEHSRRAGDHEQALVDLRVGTGHDLFGLEVESAVFRVGVAAACAFDLRDQPERCSVMNAEVSHAIRRALSVSPALDALSLRYFAARAIDCGAALLAQECLSRLLRSVPDDADAAVFVARQLQRAGFAGSAHDLADRIRTRWPDHPLPPTLDPTKR